MKVLITGAGGFVGSHMCSYIRNYIDPTAEIHPFDVVWTDEAVKRAGVSPFIVNCLDWFTRDDVPQYDYAFHFAAIIGGRVGIDGSQLGHAMNIILDTAYLRFLKRNGTKKALYMSSSAVYPVEFQTGRHLPMDEDMCNFTHSLGLPDRMYGWSKRSGEYVAMAAANEGVDVKIARPFSGYGEGQPDDYPVTAIAKRVIAEEDPLFIWGPRSQVRDFVHIHDLCAALWLITTEGQAGVPYNVSSGVPTSFTDIATMLASGNGYTPQVLNLEGKPTGVLCRVGDNARLNKLGWHETVSLAAGLSRVLESLR